MILQTLPFRRLCPQCQAPTFTVRTKTGATIPLDELPSAAGVFFVSPAGQAIPVDATGEFATNCRKNKAERYTSHHATCAAKGKQWTT